MSIGESIFLFAVAVTVGGALTAVFASSIVYALLGLIAAMFGVAGLYVYLNSTFLAMMQILIYVGAISILIAFAIMLLGQYSRKSRDFRGIVKLISALIIAVVSVFMFIRFVLANLPQGAAPNFAMTAKDIGRLLTDQLILPFELISLLLVVAIIGAVMLSINSRGDK
ncbi:MAG: NADH-quinone oxidoreductase subunit J family protein [Syntrophales bacterium]